MKGKSASAIVAAGAGCTLPSSVQLGAAFVMAAVGVLAAAALLGVPLLLLRGVRGS